MIHRQAVELTLAAKRVIDAGDMVAQELLPSAEPYREIIVAKTKSGQWSVRHLVGGEEIGGIGGCGSCAEAISAAAECGWKLDKLTVIESVHAQAAATPSPHPDYVDADRIMAKQLECSDLGEEQQAMVRGYVQGWLDEPYPLSEIFYRLDLAVANLLAGKPIHQGFVAEDSRSPALPHWQRHPR